MKQLHFLRFGVLALVLPLPAVLNGQDFINGGFEKNGNQCIINADIAVFNANVKNTHAFGSFRKPDIASSNCGVGDAKEGNWFIGLATNIGANITSEAVALELSAPVVKGAQYSLSFWTRGRLTTNLPNIDLGVSSNDTTGGVVFYTVASSSIKLNEWSEVTVRFNAPQDGKYITVRVNNTSTNSGVWLDGFHISPVFIPENVVMAGPDKKNNTPVNNVNHKEARVQVGDIYPNPSAGVFEVAADSQVLSLVVYNTLGSTVEEHKATDLEPVPNSIDLSDQQPGLYFVELATAEGKITKRIIVSR